MERRNYTVPWTQGVLEQIRMMWVCKKWRLSRNVSREVSSYLAEAAVLLRVTSTEIQAFQVLRGAWGQKLRVPVLLDNCARYTAVDASTVFYCNAGWSCLARSLLLHLHEAKVEVEKLPSMRENRDSPGVFSFEAVIYAFGGELHSGLPAERYKAPAAPLKSSEAYGKHSTSSWSDLRQMAEGRSHFNPCLHHALIYLPGGRYARSIEIFSPKANRFLADLRVQLSEASSSVSWVEDDTLLVLTKAWLTRVDLKKKRATVEAHAEHDFAAKSSPIPARDAVFFVDENDSIARVCTKAGQVAFWQALSRQADAAEHLLCISRENAQLFNSFSEQWGEQLQVSGTFLWDEGSRYILLDAVTAFCCGDSKSHTDQREYSTESIDEDSTRPHESLLHAFV